MRIMLARHGILIFLKNQKPKFKLHKINAFCLYENGMTPAISKPTRVTRKTATAVDHILTNQFINVNFKTAIFD